jgi:alpha-beta hydrolase superfamily lysophospholipase
MSFAGYNRDWSPPRTPKDWISRNERKVDGYIADPLCGFTFTNGAYRELFRGLKALYPNKISAMDKDVPVLLYSGASDPVGGRGAGVNKVAAELKAAGVQDVTVKLYENGRHEMHNEPNREEVFTDLIGWIVSRL